MSWFELHHIWTQSAFEDFPVLRLLKRNASRNVTALATEAELARQYETGVHNGYPAEHRLYNAMNDNLALKIQNDARQRILNGGLSGEELEKALAFDPSIGNRPNVAPIYNGIRAELHGVQNALAEGVRPNIIVPAEPLGRREINRDAEHADDLPQALLQT